ncbi:RfbX Membrane protein involved in the export of O-antigen and teichoic acid [Mycobacteriaceae bacterium]
MSVVGDRLAQLLRNRKALGAAWLTAADVLSKAIGFAMTPYLANRMGAAGFGELNLYVSVTQILPIVISLGGPALLTVEYIRNGYTPARRLRAANLWLSLWISCGLIVVSLSLSWWKPSAVPLSVGLLVVAVSYVQALNTLELSYYRGSQTYSFAVVGQFAFALLNVLLTVLTFEFDSPSATNRLLSVALAGGVVQLVYALELRRKSYEPADRAILRTNTKLIISFGLSVFVHVASHWIRSNIDRFVVAAHFGLVAAGTYSVAITLAMVPSVFFIAVSQQLQPYLYRRLKDRNFAGFKRIQFGYVWVVLLFTALYYGLLVAAFPLLFDSEYDGAMALLPALLGASAAQSTYHVFSHAAFYERRGGHISSVTGGALAIHLVGLAVLFAFDQITPSHVAMVFLTSSAVATLGMVFLSGRTIRQLRQAQPE